jgi:hypothetical protein
MPRTTYADRFEALLAKDYLSERDRNFIGDLYAHYKRKRALSSGRRHWFVQLEQRYASRPVTDEATSARLEVLITRMSGNGSQWESEFAGSLLAQARSGRTLSEKQIAILRKIETKWSDEAVQVRETWAENFTPEMAEKFRVMIKYYTITGYFRRITDAHAANSDMVPSREDYERITNNKYATKILAGWFSEPKFAVGSMVAFGSHTKYNRAGIGPGSLAVVLSVNDTVPTAAARGNKIYRVLPVGKAQTILTEERCLKKARVPKKKKK